MTFRLKPESWEGKAVSPCSRRKFRFFTCQTGLRTQKEWRHFLPFRATWVTTRHIAQWSQNINTLPTSHQKKPNPTMHLDGICGPPCMLSTQQTGPKHSVFFSLCCWVCCDEETAWHALRMGSPVPLSPLCCRPDRGAFVNPMAGLTSYTDSSGPRLSILVKALEKHYLLPLKTLHSQFYQALA